MHPSGPGGVRRFSLRRAQPSTPSYEAHSTRAALKRGFDPAEADCGLQGTANSPSSTATPKPSMKRRFADRRARHAPRRQIRKMAEGVGFEPTAQGLPAHGISSAAPSAARSPLHGRIWRRGEDLNPRGTFWAPIRFRVGRLQPGSATPPRIVQRRRLSKNSRSSATLSSASTPPTASTR